MKKHIIHFVLNIIGLFIGMIAGILLKRAILLCIIYPFVL